MQKRKFTFCSKVEFGVLCIFTSRFAVLCSGTPKSIPQVAWAQTTPLLDTTTSSVESLFLLRQGLRLANHLRAIDLLFVHGSDVAPRQRYSGEFGVTYMLSSVAPLHW